MIDTGRSDPLTARLTAPPRPFVVASVEPNDLVPLASHFASVADEPLFVLTPEFPRTIEMTERFLEQVLKAPYVQLVVARLTGPRGPSGERIIAGHCLIRSTDHPALCHVAKVSMAVSQPHRRMGLGQALLQRAERWAHDEQMRKITLDVLANNRPALRLYEKFRYREEGTRRDQVFYDGQFHDELLLAKFLA